MKNLKIKPQRILLIGIGNCGRGDDGLGWKLAEMLGCHAFPFLDIEYRYQLQVEDTNLIANYDRVLFADASHKIIEEGFEIKPCVAANHYFFSSHMQSPETILYLANELYEKFPEAYTIAVSGVKWELKTSLSQAAKYNLQLAYKHITKNLLPSILTLPLTGTTNLAVY